MKRIGLLSDTHGYWDDRYYKYFESCEEIWHAGDIGSMEILEKLQAFRPFRGVYGNIDGQDIRQILPKEARFTIEGADVLLKHIGGYPGRWDPSIKKELYLHTPSLFVCGHSHILKVKYDFTLKMMHMNPGAAGKYGIQAVRTLLRFSIDKGVFSDLEIIELNE